MGEAKRRGSREERVSAAVQAAVVLAQKKAEEAAVYKRELATRPPKIEIPSKSQLAAKKVIGLMGLLAGGIPVTRREVIVISQSASKALFGGRYNWKYQDDKLIYLGYNFSGNGHWHQFAKVDNPGVVWCEVLPSDLDMIEETVSEPL